MANGTLTATVSTSPEVKETKATEVALPKDVATPTAFSDPVVQVLVWLAVVVGLLISIGTPLKNYLRNEHREDGKDKVGDAKANAESSLYEQFNQQLVQYRQLADTAYKERLDLIQRVGALEAKAEDLERQKRLVEKLKERLDKKDEEIRSLLSQAAEERRRFLDILQAKDRELASRDERILVLERGYAELESRLAQDEKVVNTFVCPLGKRIIDEEVSGNKST